MVISPDFLRPGALRASVDAGRGPCWRSCLGGRRYAGVRLRLPPQRADLAPGGESPVKRFLSTIGPDAEGLRRLNQLQSSSRNLLLYADVPTVAGYSSRGRKPTSSNGPQSDSQEDRFLHGCEHPECAGRSDERCVISEGVRPTARTTPLFRGTAANRRRWQTSRTAAAVEDRRAPGCSRR